MPVAPSRTFNAPDFTVDEIQTNIILTKIVVTVSSDGSGVVGWTVSADQYNRTHATGQPDHGTVYVDLMNANGGVIPTNDRISFHPAHSGCRGMPNQVWEGQSSGFPPDGDLLNAIVQVRLACERITYDVDPC
jgi:hypothetical protein